MGTTYKVTHCFQGQGGTTKDEYCNQFYFFSVSKVPADVATWGPVLANYVHQLFILGSGGNSVSRWYHPRCQGNLGSTKIYDAGTSGPGPLGAPIFTIADEVLVPDVDYLVDYDGANGLPEEVALCLSYQAVHTDGDLPRRRGRIYLGPFNVDALDDTAGAGPMRPAGGLMDAMLTAAVLVQEGAAAYDMEWRVFSPSDGFAFKIVNFSVDNAFDTIRGRGTAPSFRTTVPIS